MSSFGPNTIVIPSDAVVARAGVLINASTAAILQDGIALGDGEPGALLNSGVFAVEDGSFVVNIFGPNFSTLGSLTPFGGANPNITSNWTDTFYAVQNGGGTVFCGVKSFNAFGTVGGTTWTLDTKTLPSVAVEDDNSILYYTKVNDIAKWNLATNTLAGTAVTGGGNGAQRDLLKVPTQAKLIVILQTAPNVYAVKIYSTAGSTLTTIALSGNAGNGSAPRLSLDVGAPSTAFWARTFQDGTGNTSNLTKYAIADGSVLETLVNVPTGTTVGTIPLSCPFFAWSGTIPAFVGTRDNNPLVRVRQVGLEAFPGNVAQFIGRAEVQMQPGLGVPADPTQTPVIGMAWSGDNAVTFNTEQPLSLGRTGAYYTRAYKHVVGGGPDMRQPACKVICSDDVTFVPTDLFVTREAGTG